MYIVAQRCRGLGNAVVPAHPTLRLQSSWQVLRAGVKGTRCATVCRAIRHATTRCDATEVEEGTYIFTRAARIAVGLDTFTRAANISERASSS